LKIKLCVSNQSNRYTITHACGLKKKAKHGAGAGRSMVYVYYDNVASFAQTQDLRLTCPPFYALGYCVELNMKKKYQLY
jgi:hypothetical protein